MAISVTAEDDLRAERLSASHPLGVARSCITYAGEKARHRIITPDGQDYIVTTATDVRAGLGFLTGAYPVSRGYLMMVRQPLVETHSATPDEALAAHDQLVRALAESGSRVVRAQAALRARKRAATVATRSSQVERALDSEPMVASSALDHSGEAFASLN